MVLLLCNMNTSSGLGRRLNPLSVLFDCEARRPCSDPIEIVCRSEKDEAVKPISGAVRRFAEGKGSIAIGDRMLMFLRYFIYQ